jgi:hypothetical protein
MRPRWLRSWSVWGDARPTGAPGDPRPLWQRFAFFIGIRREW